MPNAKSTKARASAKKPKQTDDVPATERIDAYIARLDDWRGALLARIRGVFHAADPEVVEEWKWMGSPVWSHQGILAVANAHKQKVKVTFYQGAHLPDPHRIFNAGLDGNKWRAIDLCEGDALDEAALTEVIQAAIAHNLSKGRR